MTCARRCFALAVDCCMYVACCMYVVCCLRTGVASLFVGCRVLFGCCSLCCCVCCVWLLFVLVNTVLRGVRCYFHAGDVRCLLFVVASLLCGVGCCCVLVVVYCL